MKKNVIDILDIHTHKQEVDSLGKSIINYPLLTGSSLYMPLAGTERRSFYSVGIHPWELREHNVRQQLGLLRQLLRVKRFVAVGEAGLDKLAAASMELQLEVFKEQVKLSEKCGLPLIIHCVKAMEELLAVKKEYCPQQPWIWHGFRGKPEQAMQLLKKGFYLSFGEYYSDETMQIIPDEDLFLETDNSLLDIENILCRAAKVRGVEVIVLREVIRRNIQNVFFKA
ncbi:TatD family hydrolase [Bacteroides sp. AN502(2024)]|uniref:TatD family hydrolase n=1 Tax=Bacteroides sp. AN502(2024) TaxID=3160599 RepID=UPI003513D07B